MKKISILLLAVSIGFTYCKDEDGSAFFYVPEGQDSTVEKPWDNAEGAGTGTEVPSTGGETTETASSGNGLSENGGIVVTDSSVTVPSTITDPATGNDITVTDPSQVTITDGNGDTVPTEVTVGDGTVTVSPEEPLNPENVYDINIDDGTNEYSESVYLPYDNICDAGSPYANAKYFPVAEYNNGGRAGNPIEVPFSDYLVNTEDGAYVIGGWDFDNDNFRLMIKKQTPQAQYVLVVANGIYDLPGHECELYYQRYTRPPYSPAIDLEFTNRGNQSRWWLFTDQDVSIKNSATGEYHSFAKTFVVIKVYDKDGNDITATDDAEIVIVRTTDEAKIKKTAANTGLLASASRGSTVFVLPAALLVILGFFIIRMIRTGRNSEA